MALLNRLEWLEQRRTGLGGSDSPVILGVSPFKSRLELWNDKKGLTPLETTETAPMTRGRVLEPIAADEYEGQTGRVLEVADQIIRDEGRSYMIADPDRFVYDDEMDAHHPGVLEIKCPGIRMFGKIKREGVPDYYQIQLQHYMGVTGATWGALAMFSAENWKLISFDVKRDDRLIKVIYEKGAEFWDMLHDSDEPPPVDVPGELVGAKLDPTGTNFLVLESLSWRKAIHDLKQAKDLAKEAGEIEAEAKVRVQAIMTANKATVAEGAGARIYWKESKGRLSFDEAALKKAMPDAYKKYSTAFDAARFKEDNPKNYEKYSTRGKGPRPFRPYFLREAE